MKTHAILPLLTALLCGANLLLAAEMPKMPPPQKEHEWLQQFVGEWEWDSEMFMEPGQPPMKMKGTESTRPIGGFWIVAENKGDFQGQPFTGLMTLGFDPTKQKYIGSWADSMNSYLWKYEGTLDHAGKTLTLATEGPCPAKGGALTRFKEVIELKDKDHKTFTSSMQGDDGKWTTNMKIEYRRKK